MVVAIIFLPLVFLLTEFYNIIGIIITLIMVNLSGLVFNIIQFYKIINNKTNVQPNNEELALENPTYNSLLYGEE